jgi:enoyl-CoA hydratase/carnithine racemase
MAEIPNPEPGQRLHSWRDGQVGHVAFDNPRRLNAMSLDMWQGLSDAMAEFAADPDLRVVVITGKGDKSFVSGADISEFEKHRSLPEATARYNSISQNADQALASQPKPTIAKIRGYCIGGGMGLALGCDIRICTPDAQFGIPAAKVGLAYSRAGLKRLVDLVGPAVASELMFTARRLDADEALRAGLVNHIVAADEIDQMVAGMAGRIAQNAPLTIATTKAMIQSFALDESAQDNVALDAMVDACFASEDYAEGRRAFAAKTKPDFKGR